MDLSLRFPPDEITHWASRYEYQSDEHMEQELAPRVRARGYYTESDFLTLCTWKSARAKQRYQSNSANLIEDTTRFAMSTPHERLRIGVLRLLEGVSWAVASVLLHFGHTEPYPILDYRALWSLGVERSGQYTFDVWWAYTQHCRILAESNDVSMRVLDKALWQYSKEQQPSG